ncbi:hypothetical protein D3C75_849440 [compost metagenome]
MPVRLGRNGVFLKQELQHIRHRLEKSKRTRPGGAVPELHPADNLALEENRIGHKPKHQKQHGHRYQKKQAEAA